MSSPFIAPSSVAVHPLVSLSVLDHYRRVVGDGGGGGGKRVVGALLGSWSPRGTVHITNAFAVPFSEDPADPLVWFLDADYMEAMRDLYKKVAAREKLVGWYHSGPGVRPSDTIIHSMFGAALGGGQQPVMLVFDPHGGCRFTAYHLREDPEERRQFVHIDSSMEAEEAEEVGVEHLLRDVADGAPGSLARGLAGRLDRLRVLQAGLAEIVGWLRSVENGTLMPSQAALGRLQRFLAEHRHRRVSDGAAVAEVAGDQAMLVYIGHLSRCTLALHDLIENKEQLRGGGLVR